MSDLVERLRGSQCDPGPVHSPYECELDQPCFCADMSDAASEIIRLRAENERLTGRLEVYKQEVGDLGKASDEDEKRIVEIEAERDTATRALSALRAAMRRLASMEAFTGSRAVNNPADQELLARINFAEAALSQAIADARKEMAGG